MDGARRFAVGSRGAGEKEPTARTPKVTVCFEPNPARLLARRNCETLRSLPVLFIEIRSHAPADADAHIVKRMAGGRKVRVRIDRLLSFRLITGHRRA
jgi:hypothetical protein